MRDAERSPPLPTGATATTECPCNSRQKYSQVHAPCRIERVLVPGNVPHVLGCAGFGAAGRFPCSWPFWRRLQGRSAMARSCGMHPASGCIPDLANVSLGARASRPQAVSVPVPVEELLQAVTDAGCLWPDSNRSSPDSRE